MKFTHIGMIVLLGAIWGGSFIFIFIVTPEFGPAMAMWLRVILTAIILLAITAVGGCLPDLRKHGFQYLVTGLFNAALPFICFSFAEMYISASMTSIINSTTPLSTAALASAFLNERLTFAKISGMVLGFFGVFVLVSGAPLSFSTNTLIGVALAGIAAASYSIANVYAVRNMTGRKPLESATGQFIGASAVLFVPAMLTMPTSPPSGGAILALIALVLFSSVLGYLLYFSLINALGAVRTSLYTYLVPCFGSLWAILFLGESLTLTMILGAAIILASVYFVMRRPGTSTGKASMNPAVYASSEPGKHSAT